MAWVEPTAALTPKLLAECQRRWRQRESASASGGICVIQKAEIDTFGLTELRPGVSSVPVTALATAGTSCLNCLIRGQVQAGKKLCSNVVLLRQTELGEAEVIENPEQGSRDRLHELLADRACSQGLALPVRQRWHMAVACTVGDGVVPQRNTHGPELYHRVVHPKQGVLGLGIRGWDRIALLPGGRSASGGSCDTAWQCRFTVWTEAGKQLDLPCEVRA